MPPLNPYNPNLSSNGLVDHMIGKSYEVVRTVYDYLDVIKFVALNMSSIQGAANNSHRNIVQLTGDTGILGSTSMISIPEEVPTQGILDFYVNVEVDDGTIYSGAERYFVTVIDDRLMKITLAPDAPASLANAIIRAAIFYKD